MTMTPERLAEIREAVEADAVGSERELLAEVDRLTRQLIVRTDQRDVLQQENRTLRQMAVLGERAENARLRAGIESVRVNALCAEEFLPRGSLALRETARKCAALLNSPTEGCVKREGDESIV